MRALCLAAILVAVPSCAPEESPEGDCAAVGCWLNKADDDAFSAPLRTGNVGVCLRAPDQPPYCYQGCSSLISCGPAEVCVPLDRSPDNAPRAAGVCWPVLHAEACRGAYLSDGATEPTYECRAY